MQFGQVGVGDNLDQCSPVQVRFPDDQACFLTMSPTNNDNQTAYIGFFTNTHKILVELHRK